MAWNESKDGAINRIITNKIRICPICGETYVETLAISRINYKTEICRSCGIRQATGGLLSENEVEEIVRKNKEL